MSESTTRDRVEAERQATLARIAALTAEFDDIVASTVDSNSDDEHDPEGSTIAFERSRVTTLLSQARSLLKELERAQERAADGTYGLCEVCGAAISSDRLDALPMARTCVHCAS
jgi:RNA polymerase-binding transcription factor DksA